MKSAAICALAFCMALLAACSKAEERVAPRPQAHPRVQSYDSAYVLPDGLPLHFEANAQALSEVEPQEGGAVWLTVVYPAYDAQLMCTFTPVTPATVGAVVNNRAERMALNVIGMEPQADEFINDAGYAAIIICDPVSVATPVQFLAAPADTAAARWVVSGSAYFPHAHAGAPLDSLAPMVEAMLRDVRHSVHSLK